MIEIRWNMAIGKNDDKIEYINFPEDKEKLADIFFKIRNEDYSFLGEFYKKYGPKVILIPGKANELLQSTLIEYGKKLINSLDKNELIAIESWKFLKDLEKIENVYKMHLEDWYQIYQPLLRYWINESLFIKNMLEDKNVDNTFNDIKNFYLLLKEIKKNVENFLKETMEKCCPNLSYVAGPILGAELLAIAGGLRNLSNMPGSRIQILGAGKAFFTSKKRNLNGPKHGVIFKHPYVHNSKKRGKNARILAGKIAIASRIDNFSKKLDPDFINKTMQIFSK